MALTNSKRYRAGLALAALGLAALAADAVTMLLPSFLSLIPTLMNVDALGAIDHASALHIACAAGAFGIFLVRHLAGSSIPKDLIEAARMDGCSESGI